MTAHLFITVIAFIAAVLPHHAANQPVVSRSISSFLSSLSSRAGPSIATPRALFDKKTALSCLISLQLIVSVPNTVFAATAIESDTKMASISSSSSATPLDLEPIKPSDREVQMVQMAFKDFDEKRLADADKEFSSALIRWKELHRPRDEIVSLLKARGNVRLDNKEFSKALSDYSEALSLMSADGEKDDGTGRYPEYPDTFVGRALTYEGLGDWGSALKDYDKAISLWGGGRGEGVNPFTLTFRGNTLTKLGRYEDAVLDYEAASDLFNSMRDVDRYSDAKANLALALYQLGREEQSVKAMNDVIRKNPGYADMHVAIAADAWSKGNYILALKEWRFSCDRISVGCDAYTDFEWLSTVRRWPPSLVTRLQQFLRREIPEKLQGDPSQRLAPLKSASM